MSTEQQLNSGKSNLEASEKNFDKTGVINDPLGQTHSHVSSELCFLLFCFSRFEKWGRTYVMNGQHVRKQWSLPTVTLGWPSGSIYKEKTRNDFCHKVCQYSTFRASYWTFFFGAKKMANYKKLKANYILKCAYFSPPESLLSTTSAAKSSFLRAKRIINFFSYRRPIVILHACDVKTPNKHPYRYIFLLQSPAFLIQEADHSPGRWWSLFSHRVSVRPYIPKLQIQATITSGRDWGLAEWIIDDSCIFFPLYLYCYVTKHNLNPPSHEKWSSIRRRAKKSLCHLSDSCPIEIESNCQINSYEKRKSLWFLFCG